MGVRSSKDSIGHSKAGRERFGDWGTYVHQLFARVTSAESRRGSVHVLRLRNMDLRVVGAETIYQALLDNRSVTELDLKGNGFGPKGVLFFGELLKLTATLVVLDLGSNMVGDLGAEWIAASLQKNRTLRRLDLSDNFIQQKGCQALSLAIQFNDTLTALNLSRNSVGYQGCAHLADGLLYTHTLETLVLEDNSLTDAALERLSHGVVKNRSLLELKLAKNGFTGEGVIHLMRAFQAGANQVRLLDLSTNELGPIGCKRLCLLLPACSNMVTLLLRSNRIGDVGSKHLSETLGGLAGRSMKLKCLDVSDNGIGQKGVEDLAGVLEEGSSVTSIDLSYNEIGADGCDSILNMIRNEQIRDCRVRGTCLGIAATAKVRERIQKNRVILSAVDLSDSEDDDERDRDDTASTQHSIAPVSFRYRPTSSRPGSSGLRPGSAKVGTSRGGSAKRPGSSAGSAARPSSAASVANSGGGGGRSGGGVNQPASGGARPRVAGRFTVPKLSALYIPTESIPLCYDKSIADMRKFGDPDVEDSRNCVDPEEVTQALKQLQQNDKTLKGLSLAGQRLGNSDQSVLLCKNLGIALTYNVTVLVVDLTCNNLGPLGAKLLSKALAPNETITDLSISGNMIGPRGAAALVHCLSINRTLLTLRLDDNAIGDLGVKHLVEQFTRYDSPSVTHLDLQWNGITKNSGPLINRLLCQNDVLRNLNLCGNSLGSNGLLDFCESQFTGIPLTTSLRRLDVSRNFIGDKGALQLLGAVTLNTAILNIAIEGNMLSDSVLLAFKGLNESHLSDKVRQRIEDARLAAEAAAAEAAGDTPTEPQAEEGEEDSGDSQALPLVLPSADELPITQSSSGSVAEQAAEAETDAGLEHLEGSGESPTEQQADLALSRSEGGSAGPGSGGDALLVASLVASASAEVEEAEMAAGIAVALSAAAAAAAAREAEEEAAARDAASAAGVAAAAAAAAAAVASSDAVAEEEEEEAEAEEDGGAKGDVPPPLPPPLSPAQAEVLTSAVTEHVAETAAKFGDVKTFTKPVRHIATSEPEGQAAGGGTAEEEEEEERPAPAKFSEPEKYNPAMVPRRLDASRFAMFGVANATVRTAPKKRQKQQQDPDPTPEQQPEQRDDPAETHLPPPPPPQGGEPDLPVLQRQAEPAAEVAEEGAESPEVPQPGPSPASAAPASGVRGLVSMFESKQGGGGGGGGGNSVPPSPPPLIPAAAQHRDGQAEEEEGEGGALGAALPVSAEGHHGLPAAQQGEEESGATADPAGHDDADRRRAQAAEGADGASTPRATDPQPGVAEVEEGEGEGEADAPEGSQGKPQKKKKKKRKGEEEGGQAEAGSDSGADMPCLVGGRGEEDGAAPAGVSAAPGDADMLGAFGAGVPLEVGGGGGAGSDSENLLQPPAGAPHVFHSTAPPGRRLTTGAEGDNLAGDLSPAFVRPSTTPAGEGLNQNDEDDGGPPPVVQPGTAFDSTAGGRPESGGGGEESGVQEAVEAAEQPGEEEGEGI